MTPESPKTNAGILSVSQSTLDFLYRHGPDMSKAKEMKALSAQAAKKVGIKLENQPESANPVDFIDQALLLIPEENRPQHAQDVIESVRARGEEVRQPLFDFIEDGVSDSIESIFEELNYKTLARNLKPGWCQVFSDGTTQKVTRPDGYQAAVYDCETFVKCGNRPVLGQLVTDAGELFVWTHPDYFEKHDDGLIHNQVHPSLGSEGRVFVAHNAVFDFSKTDEAQRLEIANDWLCTQAMVTASDKSTNPWIDRRCSDKERAKIDKVAVGLPRAGLKDAYGFYVGEAEEIDKSLRDAFVTMESFAELRASIATLLEYSLKDVLYTYRLLRELLPVFASLTPDGISWLGQSHIIQQQILLSPDYPAWVEAADESNHLADYAAERIWLQVIDQALEWGETLWMQHLDWSPKVDPETGEEKPAWYVECQADYRKHQRAEKPWKPQRKYGVACLGLVFKGEPIVYVAKLENPLWNKEYETDPDIKQWLKGRFVRQFQGDVPPAKQKDAKEPVGMVAKGRYEQLIQFGGGLWARQHDAYTKLLSIEVMKRAIADKIGAAKSWRESSVYEFGDALIAPAMQLPHGTLTRRASRGMPSRVKREAEYDVPFSYQKCMWQTPSEYVYVWADFDSQESRIMAIYGDAEVNGPEKAGFLGVSGASIISAAGSKSDGTDTHSLYGKSLGLARSDAKGASLGAQYGQGVRGLTKFLMSNFPNKFEDEAATMALARKAIEERKGSLDQESGYYEGGTESEAHNFIIQLTRKMPHEPFTNTVMPRHFWSHRHWAINRKPNTTSNFTCQGGGAAILCLMHGIVDDLCRRRGWTPDMWRVAFSVHDEIVCVAKREIAVEAAVLFQLAHAICWAHCFESCGIREMSLNAALFSTVGIDVRYRKDATDPQETRWTEGFKPGLDLNGEELLAALNTPGFELPEPSSIEFGPVGDYGEIDPPETSSLSPQEAFEQRTTSVRSVPPQALTALKTEETTAEKKARERTLKLSMLTAGRARNTRRSIRNG